jgi:hypothetical protein
MISPKDEEAVPSLSILTSLGRPERPGFKQLLRQRLIAQQRWQRYTNERPVTRFHRTTHRSKMTVYGKPHL